MAYLVGIVAFLVGVGVLGNRRRRGGAGHRDRYADAAVRQARAEAEARTLGQRTGGPTP